MTPRTPAAIFDEVLDALDDYARSAILERAYDDAITEGQMAAHLAQVRAYREEFREAMEGFRYHGSGPLVGTGSGTVVLDAEILQEAPPLATAGADPAGVAKLAMEEHFRAGYGQDGSESVADRGERLAARYTKDDGSAK